MITVNNLSISFGPEHLFRDISFFIGKKDRIGLVGKNGAGKSTMLKTIYGIQEPTSGSVSKPKGTTLGYLPQEMKHNEGNTVLEEAKLAFAEIEKLETEIEKLTQALNDREDYQSDSYAQLIVDLNEANDRLTIMGSSKVEENIEKILTGLGFESTDMDRQMNEFSGGWKMRVELAKILLIAPDILLLDEPTNHLDIESIEWLEGFLANYDGALLMISHDRMFLDKVTNRTIEISNGKVYDYKFSYTKYIKQRTEELEQQREAYKNQQKYIEDTQKLIDKFRAKANKAAFAQSLIKKLDKLDRIELDEFDNTQMNISFPPAPRSGKVVLKAEDLKKSFDGKTVFQNVDLSIGRQEKVALVGKNGAGKTTLSRIIKGELDPDSGSIELGHNVKVGYYAQNQSEQLDEKKTVFETIDDIAEGEIRKQIRAMLGAFLFSGEDADKKVSVLSGGEKARLALCKLMLEPKNFLILDEPTNHLDLKSKEVLKNALIRFDGTLLVVSHDRDFLHELTTAIYEVKKDGLRQYLGDIFDFLKDKKAESIAEFEVDREKKKQQKAEAKKPKETQQQFSYEERKDLQKKKRKLQNTVTKCEREIEKCEERIAELDKELLNVDFSNPEESQAKLDEYAQLKKKVEDLMKEWENAELELDGLPVPD
ncbi:ABC-F family ATP-binding cassette domain-containing protein [Halocola ammonii]